MANRFNSPNQQFVNSAGIPYSGGQLFFYASGTSTPLNTYSDSGLTTPNANPVILDSAGRAGSVFLQNLAYKVVLEDSLSNIIWTEDPVSTSDFTATAQFLTYTGGNPNGHVAGTAGSTGVPASVVWDSTNNILYVCTTTGNAASAIWTAVNATAAQSNVPAPQGRLTLTSGTPVINSDVISATSVFYTAYVGNLIPVFNGAQFSLQAFASDLTLTLTASQAASTLYDVFAFLNSSVLTLATGPAWTNSTAGSCARGSGAGTTQLTRVNGIWVNAVQITGKNGANTYTIPANQATYLGTLSVDSVAGQATHHVAYGQSRKIAEWNAYNRVPVYLIAGDSTASWSEGSASLHVINANTANSLTVLCGLAEETFSIKQFNNVLLAGASSSVITAVGWNSVTVPSGFEGVFAATTVDGNNMNMTAYYDAPPALGINTVSALTRKIGGASSDTFSGTQLGNLLSAIWRA